MRLYPKMILIIACTFFAVMSVLLVSFEYTVMDSFSSLEQNYMERDLLRSEHAIQTEVDRLSQIAQDWGEWDSTYEFMETRDPAFITSNIALSTFETLKISYFIILAPDGTSVIERGISESGEEISGVPPDLITRLSLAGRAENQYEGKNRGLLNWDDKAWIITRSDILTTNKEGPSRGSLFLISPLDDEKLSEISAIMLQNVSARILTPQEMVKEQMDGGEISIVNNSIIARKVLSDVSDQPFLLLTVERTRDLWESGRTTRNYLFFSLLLLVVCFMGVAVTLINLVIIAPLGELNKELASVGQSGLLSGRIKTGREDEIGDLSRSINMMLNQIENAVEQRHTTEQRLSRLIALAEEGIGLIGPDKRIWFANPRFAAIFGSTPYELSGKSIIDIIGPGLPDEARNSLLTEKTERHEFLTHKNDGTEISVRVITAPYPLDIGEEGHICVIGDITTFKENEKALLLSNKKLSLLGSMTRHDIVNQLTTIRGMLGLIHRKTNDEIIINLVETAEEAAERVNKHIEFSKEYQKAGIQAPLWQNLKATWSLAYAMTKKKGLTFSYEGLNYEIFADQLLQKVFYNLIDNSLKHGKNVFYITIKTEIRNKSLIISFEDDGEGIPENMKERIFERGVGAGTGWGLFFVREVLSLTGISIRETGTYGIGVRFEVIIPEGGFHLDVSSTE